MRGLIDSIVRCGLARCQRGATAIEYGLILTLIFLAIISAVGQLANENIEMWDHVAEEVNSH
ncbi:pilus assembly protein Flp/PilA [Sphingobium wenxiniae]|uniref:Pilus assembly protein Flp/PilA n=1 Tax=Sphingobium wenxiniae (strain DSM 21828 / CGMCC 1.7748 / JZ-1) TaxID=595605 RepID=A0A562KNA6_SPHWJ|nr:Flp family type IVb pilin [Sphingobium wenxiniae]MBB6191885.1 pilus assembly protein Flp/PilA [Sphingobium wenxiniae]TWH96918.1 pilus assembly protein Flp/PilA [Sphingobium wenxiniae]